MWTIEFGNNYQEQLKQAENNLAAHLRFGSITMAKIFDMSGLDSMVACLHAQVRPWTSNILVHDQSQNMLKMVKGVLKLFF